MKHSFLGCFYGAALAGIPVTLVCVFLGGNAVVLAWLPVGAVSFFLAVSGACAIGCERLERRVDSLLRQRRLAEAVGMVLEARIRGEAGFLYREGWIGAGVALAVTVLAVQFLRAGVGG